MNIPTRSSEAFTPLTVSALLVIAAGGTILRGVGAGMPGVAASLTAAVLLLVVAWGALRTRSWALGAAFFLGVFWLWAVVALGLQQRLSALEAGGWIVWSLVVIVASVRTRRHA